MLRRAAFVTGGASGLGRAVVERLAGSGMAVAVADLPLAADAAMELVASLPAGKAEFFPLDVRDEAAVSGALDAALERLGPLRAAVSCAGVATPGKVLGKRGPLALEAFRGVLDVNAVGTFNVLRLAAERMSANEPDEHGQRGVVVNTASIAAFEGQIGQAAYAASKAAVVGMTLPAARELAAHGIRVMAVAPGLFATPLLAGLPPAVQDELGATVPFPPRLGRPEEFAQLVEDILDNPMLNGGVVRLDGALRMTPT